VVTSAVGNSMADGSLRESPGEMDLWKKFPVFSTGDQTEIRIREGAKSENLGDQSEHHGIDAAADR